MSEKIQRYTLSNSHNMQVTLANYGARVLSIKVPSPSSGLIEVTKNHDNDDDILNDSAYMGAICGRVANRISNASFELQGERYYLNANEGNNMLHGGAQSFSHRFWRVKSQRTNSLIFSLQSAHLDQGFPGNLDVEVCYTLTDKNELCISFSAQSDQMCPINMCNHTYFTLGETKGIHNLSLQLNASHYLPVDDNAIPNGLIAPVTDTMSFIQAHLLKDKLRIRDFDDCYIANTPWAARLCSAEHHLQLEISTDQAGLQVYTGNFLEQKHSAIALEAQGLIDALNHSNLKADYVGPGLPYQKSVNYRFSATSLASER